MLNDGRLVNQHESNNFWKGALAFQGSITPRVMTNVFIVIVYTVIIDYMHYLLDWSALPIAPFEYAGALLGLVLVFRINAGYERWWEARKLWGSVVNQSRNLAIIVCQYTSEKNNDLTQKITDNISAIPFLMKNHLRNIDDLSEVSGLITTEQYKKLKDIQHRPNIISADIAASLSELKQKGLLDQFSFLKAEEQRSIVIDCQGACERILKTPMPLVMGIKIRRFILIFLITLPFTVADPSLKFSFAPFVIGVVAYVMFSLDRIGVELQNPFKIKNSSHLPLTDICLTIKNNIAEINRSSCTAH